MTPRAATADDTGVQAVAFDVVAPRPKGERSPDDFYRTPDWVIENFLNRWVPLMKGDPPRRILEPAAGDGAILDWLGGTFPRAHIDASDMNPRRHDIATRIFPWWNTGAEIYDLTITNPPFSQAFEFVQQGIGVTRKDGYVAMFLPQQFLSSAKRAPWLRANMPERVYCLSDRPSFYGGGNDARDYAWFVWRVGFHPRAFIGEII